MNYELKEYIEEQLKRFPKQDVLVYVERQGLRFTFGFFVWNDNIHSHTTITDLRENGFEKEDIKEFRRVATKMLVIEDILRKFTIVDKI